jgi:hypothetical protein
MLGHIWFALVVGVGNDPDPLPAMRGTNVRSSYSVPFRVIPERGKVTENGSHSSSKERCDVLHDDIAGSYFANDPSKLVPKTGPSTGEASTFSSDADVLAWESAADEVDVVIALRRERPHVFMLRDFRPVLFEDCGCIRVNLHLPLARHARSFKAERKATDTGE